MSKIYEPLDDLKNVGFTGKTLPFWKIAGPGAILVGLSPARARLSFGPESPPNTAEAWFGRQWSESSSSYG